MEQASIVTRVVDQHRNISEEFLAFITVECITSEVLAIALLSWLQEHNANVLFCRGQGYVRASIMPSSTVGVQD